MLPRLALLASALALAPSLAPAQALEGRLKAIKGSKTISVAYRADAAPFSFLDDQKQPAGYSIDLCKRVVTSLEQQLGVQGLQVKWVPVTTQTRFDAVAKGEADLECGSSTVTLGRLKLVDFSSFTFAGSTGLLVKVALGAKSLSDLAGKKIGVVVGTTNEKALQDALRERMVTATTVPLQAREEGLSKLEAGEIDAFASDKLLLLGLGPKAKDPKALEILPDDLSFEPYAIVLPRGDAGFRLAVNTALAQVYRGEAIVEIYGRWFGALGKPGGLLRAMYLFGAIPE